MRQQALLFSFLFVIQTAANAQPVVYPGGVLNAASYAVSGLPHAGIAQGSLFTIFGEGLGPDTLQSDPGLPKQTELAGTSVQVTAGQTTVDAYLYYTFAGQVGAVLPSTTPTGEGTLTVTYNGQTSAPVAIQVVERCVGIFTRNEAGHGPAIIQNWYSETDIRTNGLTEAAHPGQIVILWGTGLGPVSFSDAGAPPEPVHLVDAEVLVGGRKADLQYAGRSGTFPGVDQIQFTIPQDIEGCRVPVAVKVNDVVSNYGTMAIAATDQVCSDPTDYSAADLSEVLGAGQARIGIISLSRIRAKITAGFLTLDVAMDEGSADFFQRDLPSFLAGGSITEIAPSLGTCIVYTAPTHDDEPDPFPEDRVYRLSLDAGPAINLTGPAGTKQLEPENPQQKGVYEADLGGGIPGTPDWEPEFLVPGPYTADNGAGGTDVGPFQAALTIPQATFTWANQDTITEVDRTKDLTVTWTGADPANEFVAVAGISANVDSDVSGAFVCSAQPSAGSFTVPSTVLSSLPANSPWTGEDFPFGALVVATAPLTDTAKFSAEGLDLGYFIYMTQLLKNVNFK